MNQNTSHQPSQAGRKVTTSRTNRLVTVSVALAAIAGILCYYYWPSSENADVLPDPRLSFETPYENVHPDVQYVDDLRCAECHAEIAENYSKHPMANSLRPIAEALNAAPLNGDIENPFQRDGYEYSTRRDGETLIQSETRRDLDGKVVSYVEEEVGLAVGAGRHAVSYLLDRDGCYFYSPVTWYSRRGRWDVSPAFVNTPHHFTETVGRLCLSCHGDRLDSPQPAENLHKIVSHRIGCQRCHGPGESHVRRQGASEEYTGQDFTIVNPAKLKPHLRDAVCEQCHLEGISQVVRRGRDLFDYRPGLPLNLIRATYLPSDATETNFVGHPEQMRESACYKRSEGTFSCISCHDPHFSPTPKKRVGFFRARCLNCHQDDPCIEPPETRLKLSPANDCTHCHMPERESSDIGHVAITDHRIPRRPTATPVTDKKTPNLNQPLLKHFHEQLLDRDDPNARRDLGIGLMRYAQRVEAPIQLAAIRQATPLLQAAVDRDPGDAHAWESLGGALYASREFSNALSAYDQAIRADSSDTSSMSNAALILIKLERYDEAIEYLKRALRIEPQHPRTRRLLGDASLFGKQFSQAMNAYQIVLKYNPADLFARQGLGEAMFHAHRVDEALAEFELNLKHDAKFLPSLQSAGDCHAELKRWKEAISCYKRVLSVQPNNSAVRKQLRECSRQASDE